MSPKLIYFAERHPRFDAAGFHQRWRDHGRLGMSLPRWRNIARYTQCERVVGRLEGVEIACDGVATVTFRSEEARLAHIADPDGAVTKADEVETFARPVRDLSVLTEPHVVRAAAADMRTKVFVAVRRSDGVEPENFARAWTGDVAMVIADRLAASGSPHGYVQNVRRDDWAALGIGFDADCVDEIAAGDPAVAWPAYGEAVADAAAQVCRGISFVVTRETLLSDIAQP